MYRTITITIATAATDVVDALTLPVRIIAAAVPAVAIPIERHLLRCCCRGRFHVKVAIFLNFEIIIIL